MCYSLKTKPKEDEKKFTFQQAIFYNISTIDFDFLLEKIHCVEFNEIAFHGNQIALQNVLGIKDYWKLTEPSRFLWEASSYFLSLLVD